MEPTKTDAELNRPAEPTVDPLEERRKNMSPSDYLRWRMDYLRLTDEQKTEIANKKLKIAKQVSGAIDGGPLIFNNKMIDTLLDEGVSEDTLKNWINKALEDKKAKTVAEFNHSSTKGFTSGIGNYTAGHIADAMEAKENQE